MAEDPQPQPLTLQQRIAALNASHVGRSPSEAPSLRPKPGPIVKQKSFNIPNENLLSTQPGTANLPAGPPPLPARKAPPPLPSRKSQQIKQEIASDANGRPAVTTTRTKSEDNGRVKAPVWHEAMILPPIHTRPDPNTCQKPASRPQATTRTPSVSSTASTRTTTSNGSRPPPLPSRKSTDDGSTILPRKLPPMPSVEQMDRARKASFASIESTQSAEPVPPLPTRRPSAVPSLKQARQSIQALAVSDEPPPIPRASRPDLAALQATKPKLNGHSTVAPSEAHPCMTCRDFSGPDNHAAQFPRQNVSSLPQLAQQLVAPFSSPTDKARAIFTWLHYNIDYNTRDFFAGNIKSSTPQSTLQSGLAVCEGYAALFTCLATYAGLESKVVSGHGKGFGHIALAPGAPLPPYEGNHAWNVIKIDNGEWKLIDSCWGAGHVQGANSPYVCKFSPERFTQSNEEFGIDHFPNNQNDFYTGRAMSWEEYIQINPALWPYTFERPTLFDNAKTDYSVGKNTVLPPNRNISVYQQGTVRFHFGLLCPHWTLERHTRKGPPPVFILACGGIDGRNKHYVPLEHVKGNGSGGDLWYADVHARELGAPGETLTLFAVTSFGNRQDARGLSVQEFKAGIGRTAMGFVGVAAWTLV